MSKTVSANSIRIILDSAHSSYNPLTVLAGVTVTGGGYGVVSDASRIWTITNQGTIQGTLSTGAGIDLFDGGVVQNNGSAAHITGGSRGLYIEGGAGTVTNQGTISATTTSGTGLDLLSGGTVVNSGLISGGQYGISAAGNPTTVINQGEISQFGTYGYGMYLFAGGQVTNSSTAAFIKGFFDGIASGGYVDILNKGNIQGTAATGNGINMFAGGKVANSGVNSYIYGGNNGVWAQVSTAAVSNQGVILGGGNGVLLAVGGSVTNIGGSSYIYGHNDGVLAGGNAVVVNQGGIDGGHGYGVYLDAGGVVTNSGVITGYFDGFASTGDATVFNQGSISGSQASGNGINLFAGGTVTNSGLHARIAGPRRGVWVQGSAGTVINQGTIAGGDTISRGLEFAAGGLVSNSGTGAVISGGQYGALATIGGVTVVNQGVISGGPGIGVKSGATAATTISDAGTISGGTAAVQFGNVDGNLFRLLPRAVAIGAVQGGTGVDTLALGAGVPVGFIAGIGSQFTGFEALDVDADANWRMTGANALGASATIDVAGAGRLSVIGTLTAPANLTITGDGVLTAAASGRIEVGTLASAHAGQIVVDAGHTLVTGGGLLASVIRNLGSISGPGANGYGVHLVAAASVTNFGTAARISGGLYGVYASDHSATLVNQGGISGAAGQGVHLGAGGTVANNGAAASISGAQNGIYANGAAATVTNQGTIAATSGDGIDLAAGGVLTNGAGAARISGTADGVVTGGAATIVNAGSISGASADGVYLGAGGAVSNGSTAARISGGQWGVDAYGGVATITNHGTIAGATGAVRFGNASGNLLRLFPGAVTGGAARGGSGVDTLALGSGATVGTITGIGTAFTGFEVLAVDAGARWLAAGANTMLPTATIALADGGSLGVSGTLVAPASLTITGTGTLAANGGHIEVGTGAAALANQVVIDAGRTLTSSGVLSAAQVIVASGGLLIGTGAAIGAVANSGKIQALGGTLTVPGNLSGGGTLQSAPGATLTLNGAANTTAVAIDNGIVSVGAGASLDITGSVFAPSTGLFTLNDASFLELAADTGGANRISFAGPAGSELIVDAIAKFGTNVGLGTYSGPLLQNFGGAGDEIDLKNLALAGATKLYNPATGLLQLGNGAARATLRFENSSLTGSDFQLGNDTTGHVLLTHV